MARRGATDFASLFAANSPWSRVAGRTHVFNFYSFSVDTTTTTAKLRRMVDAPSRRARSGSPSIRYALKPEGGCGVGFNGFGGGADWLLPVLRRIRSVGGTVSYVSIDEPFSGGVLDDGPNACHWSVETVAEKLAAQVKRVHAEFPDIEIGLIEGYNGLAVDRLRKAVDHRVRGRNRGAAAVLPRRLRLRPSRLPTAPHRSRPGSATAARGSASIYTTWPPAKTDAGGSPEPRRT